MYTNTSELACNLTEAVGAARIVCAGSDTGTGQRTPGDTDAVADVAVGARTTATGDTCRRTGTTDRQQPL